MHLLKKFITRDASLVSLEKWYDGLIDAYQGFFMVEYPENVFIFQHGTVDFYRDNEKNMKDLPLALAEWVKTKRDKIELTYQPLVEGLKIVDEIQKKDYSDIDKVLADIDKAGEAFKNAFKGIITTFWIPIWQEHYKKQGITLFEEELVKETMEWRDKTGNIFDGCVDAFFTLLKKIAQFKNWDEKFLKFITYDELNQAIGEDELPVKELQKRQNNVFALIKGQIVFEQDIDSKLEQLGFELEKEEIGRDIKELKGNVANKGIAKGKVKLVFNRDQINKVVKGDILVAPMTTPWYLPAMKKAAGFITDEGGVTCHAAIVAREMNKPCIIGTKIATQVLKDGDEIEVDANSGVVKII